MRPAGADRQVIHVNLATRKVDGPHKKKLRTYLRIVARDKVYVTYENWKQVPAAQKDLIWEDIQDKEENTSDCGERWRQFKSDLTSKWALAADKDSVDDTVCEKYNIGKEKWAQFCQSHRDSSWEDVRKKTRAIQKQNTAPHILSCGGYEHLEKKLMAEKTKKKLEEAAQSGSTEVVIDPPSPIKRHVKWKMTRTKKISQMTSEAAKEIAEKIDVLSAAIGRPEHPSRGLALPPEVGPLAARVSTKESCVDPTRNNSGTGDSDKCGLYIEENPPRLVALGRIYEGSTTVHNIPLLHDQVKVGVEEIKVGDALIPVPTNEVMRDVTVFRMFNEDFPLYIKHEDLSEIANGGQCLSISVIQLWIPALKGLDDTPQPKSKAGARWIVVKYFNDVRPLKAERLKVLRIQWAKYYLKVRNQT
ncbi:hypothetical protein GmHk_01G001323 [Glycine max]|nr:hypothetical protein GmHk_01G001323 [Glycine max]